MNPDRYAKLARILNYQDRIYDWMPLYGDDGVVRDLQRVIRDTWHRFYDVRLSLTKNPRDQDIERFVDGWEYFVAGEIREQGLSFDPPPTPKPQRRSRHHCYINVYIEDRAYGGSEEGGWWYDTQSPVYSLKVSRKRLPQELSYWNWWIREENKDRNSNISSVLSEGRYTVCVEDQPGRSYPGYRPRYE